MAKVQKGDLIECVSEAEARTAVDVRMGMTTTEAPEVADGTGHADGLDGMFSVDDHSLIEETPQGISEQIMRLSYVLSLTTDTQARKHLAQALAVLEKIHGYQLMDLEVARRRTSIKPVKD